MVVTVLHRNVMDTNYNLLFIKGHLNSFLKSGFLPVYETWGK